MSRFNTNLSSDQVNEVTNYLQGRIIQIKGLNKCYRYNYITCHNWGQIAHCTYSEYDTHDNFVSIYVYENFRGNGFYKKLCKNFNRADVSILTFKDCLLEDYLIKNQIIYECADTRPAYKLIEKYYDGKYSKRTGLHYMNHIDEGLCYLESMYCENSVKDAYCLHPIYQDGNEELYESELSLIINKTKILAKRYAEVANSYLPKDLNHKSPPKVTGHTKILLTADKLQNFKDFHNNLIAFTNEKIIQLDKYFNEWFKSLDIVSDHMKNFCNYIEEVTVI